MKLIRLILLLCLFKSNALCMESKSPTEKFVTIENNSPPPQDPELTPTPSSCCNLSPKVQLALVGLASAVVTGLVTIIVPLTQCK